MKQISLLVGLVLLLNFSACSKLDDVDVVKDDDVVKVDDKRVVGNTEKAKIAFAYLNEVRSKPSAKSEEYAVDLNSVEARPALIWNEILAKAAYEKAKDMATRNYFEHVDPDGYGMNMRIKEAGYGLADYLSVDLDQNNFESLICGTSYFTAEIMIKKLIIDQGVPSLGHRIHLLGMDDFTASLIECGIGFYSDPNSTYINYACVLIAKHK